jgi:hypothetical protein
VNIQGLGQIDKVSDMEQFTRTCEWCEQEFITEWETKLYCSRSHKEQSKEYRKRQREGRVHVYRELICPVCQLVFHTRRQNQIYCQQQCRDWSDKQMRRERDREYANKKTPAFKARIYWLNNGLCHLCQQPIDTAIKHPDPFSFSIDHVIPRSKQGSHSIENLRPAHLSCNINRGDKPIHQ